MLLIVNCLGIEYVSSCSKIFEQRYGHVDGFYCCIYTGLGLVCIVLDIVKNP